MQWIFRVKFLHRPFVRPLGEPSDVCSCSVRDRMPGIPHDGGSEPGSTAQVISPQDTKTTKGHTNDQRIYPGKNNTQIAPPPLQYLRMTPLVHLFCAYPPIPTACCLPAGMANAFVAPAGGLITAALLRSSGPRSAVAPTRDAPGCSR